MATLQNYISLRDGVSPMLEKMSRAAHTVSNKLNCASGSDRRRFFRLCCRESRFI